MKRLGDNVRLATELGVAMGVVAAACTLLGLWLGLWVDAKLGTSPIATLLLLLAGAAAGQISLFRLVGRARAQIETEARHAFSLRDALRAAWLALILLLLLAVPILLGLVIGIWLDGLWGTHVIFTLALSLGFMAVGMFLAIRVARARSARSAKSGERGCSSATDQS